MCGIFGHIGFIEKEIADLCTNTLSHRGPDGSGILHFPDATLGHRRLSILDLSNNAKQPMSFANERFWITFNGEIYNFIELRKELEAKGCSFKSDSDTEVILAAFSIWGEACLERFNGMWAFAIWDKKDKSLFLSRDRFGKKPLFYTFLPGSKFAFASEMKGLFPLMGTIKSNNSLVTNRGRIFAYENTEECLIQNIKRFPAGHSGWLKKGKLEIKRWWCTLDHLSVVPLKYEDQVDQFRELFLDACRIRMRSDVPIGTALSGGLDSSATISAMAHISRSNHSERGGQSWQHAFVAAFPGTPFDETFYAKKTADHLGIEATFLEIDPLQSISKLDDYFYCFEEIYVTSPIPFMLTYGSVKSHGISVTLDGHGADELFAGYHFDYLVALRDAGFNFKQASQIVNAYFDGQPKNSHQFVKSPSKVRFIAEYHARNYAKKILGKHVGSRSLDDKHPLWKGLGYLNQQLYVSTHETILPTLLRNYDRYSMFNGVEIRMPFMDHRIVSFAFSIPWSSKIRNGFSKAIVRDAMSPFMPNEITYRKSKIGFNSPIVDWMKGPLRSYFLDTISSVKFKTSNLINPKAVEKILRYVIENPNARFSDGELAWTMLTPFLWEQSMRKHVDFVS